MSDRVVRDADYEPKIRASFDRQKAMALMGARLGRIEPGVVEIELPFSDEIVQQHGFVHAGVITSIADSAAGYAARTLMDAGSAVMSVEFKVNLLAPAAGERFVARGEVIRSGKTLTVCRSDVLAHQGGETRLIATLLATMMRLTDRGFED
ncbi:hypothetical protein ABI59_09545 [Acidobacteria bacterium Mor1]|nr:hypothetical protein ABI59_09545 [Acidobacteria bacterium Mor1]